MEGEGERGREVERGREREITCVTLSLMYMIEKPFFPGGRETGRRR